MTWSSSVRITRQTGTVDMIKTPDEVAPNAWLACPDGGVVSVLIA